MAALASETRNVRVGCLVFCVCYRSAGLLAKAAVTIDHLSGGRCELGIGAGWNEIEARAFGVPFPPMPERITQLEETARVLRGLFDGERVTFAGRHVQMTDALCEPRPVQPRLRLWIGGQGEKRMLRIVARWADGWNVPFLAPEVFAQRNATLDRWCEREKRDPRAIIRTINLGLAIAPDEEGVRRREEDLRLMFGPMTDLVRPGILVGRPAEVIDRIGEYQRAGAEWIIMALRAPFDWDGLELFMRNVMPAFAS
jgi:alkanesulfonate monooxygenase SsuD/methylene tetrahydromethanopterin reductase-like flavin-dependent oxidoreductase (luciferase family)